MNCIHMNLQYTNVHKGHFYISLQNLERLFLEFDFKQLIYLTSKMFSDEVLQHFEVHFNFKM